MATGIDLRLPQPLDVSNITKEWPTWKQAFGNYLRATNKTKESEPNKVATFLWLIGPRGVEIYNTLFPEEVKNKNLFDDDVAAPTHTLAKVIGAFDGYCTTEKNVAMQAYSFNCLTQKDGQRFAEFETELRTQASHCEFVCRNCKTPYTDRMIRDRIVVGVQSKPLQVKLLDGRDEPLAKVIQTCRIFEAACENQAVLDKPVPIIKAQPDGFGEIAAITRRKDCFNCGKPFTKDHRRECSAVGAKCYACGGVGHFSKRCRRKPENQRTQSDQQAKQRNDSGNRGMATKSVCAVEWSDA
ncbi:uncharacterized protein LOC131214353, partial [Anopheles bellator]|uniref:uncharacterized protein LOC131214353 n=1 Tax=Anopheles bellator TaxID=139047 RepID=UPI0026491F0C